MHGKITTIAVMAMLAQPIQAAELQTRPRPERHGQERPVPLPQPVPDRPGANRPVPLPQPVPDWQRPTPLPQPVPGRPPQVRPPRGDGFAGRITCESRNNRTQRCNARTQNRVELLTRSAACSRGNWGYDQRHIWVSRNCRGTFAYGYGRNNWDRPGSSGPSTGAIIGGVTVAAGLAALLANRNNARPPSAVGNYPPPPPPPPPRESDMRPQPLPEPEPEAPPAPAGPFPPGPPAKVVADLSVLPADSRPAMNTCLQEAARQVGITGGTQLRFDRLTWIEPGNGGWRFRAQLIATYPDAERILPLFCRATPTRVVELDFRS